MYGAILGDMIGAPYEFDRGNKTKDFPLFSRRSEFTDDSVMTIAVAEALMNTLGRSDEEIKNALVASMQKWGHMYPDAGYGGRFYHWLRARHPEPYGSYGNGSAMRVSSAGWLFETLEETRRMARLTAEVTHNHPEGIKGAEATASAIFMARNGSTKDEIRVYIIREFGYDLSRTCDEIRPDYHHVESCQKTVPEAVTAFLEGIDFEDVIRTAVSLGGDCDTLTCTAGSMAEAMYGVPEEIRAECRKRLPEDMLEVLDRFQRIVVQRKEGIQRREEKNNWNRARNRYYIEKIDSNTYVDNRRIKPEYCHAFINNIAFPKSLEEIKEVYFEEGRYDIEALLAAEETCWTAPRWAMMGDVCLFMHAKTANSTISSLKTELMKNRHYYSDADFQELSSWLDRGKELYKKYGGKIFAVACVFDSPEEYFDSEPNEYIHWGSRLYADMGEIWHLQEPIDISEFKKYVAVSNRGAITPVYGEEYAGLKKLILEKNQDPPEYFISSVASDAESSRINRFNWLKIAYKYRHSLIYEKQFRLYYVDYFLSALGDIKTIYSECRCIKHGVTDLSRMDNVIRFYRRYLPVEVKLAVATDTIATQVTKYCNDDVVYLDTAEKREVRGDRFYNNHVLLIDVDNIFLYDDRTGTVDKICNLDDIRTEEDIRVFREKLAEMLLSEYPELEKERRWRKNDREVYRNN